MLPPAQPLHLSGPLRQPATCCFDTSNGRSRTAESGFPRVPLAESKPKTATLRFTHVLAEQSSERVDQLRNLCLRVAFEGETRTMCARIWDFRAFEPKAKPQVFVGQCPDDGHTENNPQKRAPRGDGMGS
jgi:hypothetical protein